MTRTNKILLALVAVVGAGCAFYFLALGPKRDEVAKLDTEIAAKTAEVEQARTTLAEYERARATYKTNYETLARLGKAVPADDDVSSLLVQLESAADRSGVDFQKVELTSGGAAGTDAGQPTTAAAGELAPAPGTVPVASGALSAMPFSFGFTGSYFDLNTFFSRLEHFVALNNKRLDATGRLIRLESVSIAPATTGFPQMKAEITAATYLVPPVQGVPGAAPSAAQPEGTTQATPSTATASATTGAAQ
jgi:Tfp pilus assembly protein PilO